MIKEQVVSALSALGFIPEEIEDFGYRFDYEGLTLIYIMFDNQVWLNYQHYAGENEVTASLIEHMVRVLAFSTINFHKIINGDDNDD